MPGYSRVQYLQEFELRLAKEFDYDGCQAEWAPGETGPRFWGDEDEKIQLKTSKASRPTIASALTPDHRYLAVATDAVIRIYDLASLEMCSEIVGHESDVSRMFFADKVGGSHADEDVRYILLSQAASIPTSDERKSHVWHIRADGRLSKHMTRMPIAVEYFTDKAIQAIAPDLQSHHDLRTEEITTIREAMVNVLRSADGRNRLRYVPTLDGPFPGFNSVPFSHNGRQIMHIAHANNTQSGMRPPEELPQLVITELATMTEICRLKGHEDSIMWAGWSHDDKTVVTASWDQTFRIWNADTGECKHIIGKTGGQNWAGVFLPDQGHVLLSGGRPVHVGIYNLNSGQEVATLSPEERFTLDHWMRYFAIHPLNGLVVCSNKSQLLAWTPLEHASSPSTPIHSQLQEIFAFEELGDSPIDRFTRISTLKWDGKGDKFLAQTTENTIFVWDKAAGRKWRFQRPQGTPLSGHGEPFIAKRRGEDWVVSVDGDGVVRLWKL